MTKKLIDYFKKFYKKKESRNLVLIERFDYIPSLVNYALLSNVLSDVHDAKIISYYPNSTNFLKLFYQKFKEILKNKNIDYLYESFGSVGIVKPKINKNKKIKFKVSPDPKGWRPQIIARRKNYLCNHLTENNKVKI